MSAVLLNPPPQCSELKLLLSSNMRERDPIFKEGSDDLKVPECLSALCLCELGEVWVLLLHALASSCRKDGLFGLTSIGIDLELLHTRGELLDRGLAIEPGGI